VAKILVADDARVVRMLMRTWLERLGHDVQEADDGASAIAALRRASEDGQPFRAAFCDVNMPRLSGLQVLDAAREVPALNATPIVLVTTLGEEGDRARGEARGAAAYLTKPVTFADVRDALSALGVA
jgi:CheY-like chemotaxis protein